MGERRCALEEMELNSSKFWHSRSVLVTGHTGFKGGWLCLWLRQLGATVTGYALPPEGERNLYEAAKVQTAMAVSNFGDIRDLEKLKHHVSKTEPEIVFHLAAQPLVRRSYQDPLETFSTNVMGTANLLHACQDVDSIKAIVVVTTDKCYQNQEWEWGYRETDHLGGSDPYSSSKACAELVTSAFRKSFFKSEKTTENGIGIATARAGNVIGGGDWSPDRLIPDCLRAVEKGASIQLRNPTAIRPWQHVLEPIRAYLILAEQLVEDPKDCSEAFNFGPFDNDVVSVQDIVKKISFRLPQALRFEIDRQQNPHESKLLKLDSSKAASKLGWRPLLDIDRAVELTLDWYSGHYAGKSPRDLTESQIEHYRKLTDSMGGE